MDDYFVTGILANNANVTHEFFNSLYIINGNLIDQRFLGKQSDYTVFGHIPDALGKMYKLWNHILDKQLSRFPNLYKSNANLINKNDFNYLKDFSWDSKIWQPFYDQAEKTGMQTTETYLNIKNYDY